MRLANEILTNPDMLQYAKFALGGLKTALHASIDHLPEAGMAAGFGVGAGLAEVEAITIGAHGSDSHDSTTQSNWLKRCNDTVMWTLGADSKSWTSSHVGSVEIDGTQEGIAHHGMTDANIAHSTRIVQYLRVIESDPVNYKDYPRLPKEGLIPNLDRGANFMADEVIEMGEFGIAIMQGLMGKDYNPPTEYTLEEAKKLFDFSYPRFVYKAAIRHEIGKDYSFDEAMNIILSGPYEPANEFTTQDLDNLDEESRELVALEGLAVATKWGRKAKNGAKAIDFNNLTRFRGPADYFRHNPNHAPDNIKKIENLGPKNSKGIHALFTGMILSFTGAILVKNGMSLDSIATGVAGGASAAGLTVEMALEGGRKTNAYGHFGRIRAKDLLRAWMNKPAELVPNYDGSYMTNIIDDGSLLYKIMSRLNVIFFDETLRQGEHHEKGRRRRYTRKFGHAALNDAPVTTTIQFAAEHDLGGLHPGKQFGLPEGVQRPDDLNSIVKKIIQPARVRRYYPDIYQAWLDAGSADNVKILSAGQLKLNNG